MAMIDYGAILRRDGQKLNNDLFMDSSDLGYVCKSAVDTDGKTYDIDGNYFVYAGDKEFLVVFYKGLCKLISNERVIRAVWNTPFISEELIDPAGKLPTVKITHLDKNIYREYPEKLGTWEDYVREGWVDATGKERISDLQHGWERYKWFCRQLKRNARLRKTGYYTCRSNRYIATWEYKGHKYEVVFGYGIDPDKEVYDEIKCNDGYGYTDIERKFLDEWFK